VEKTRSGEHFDAIARNYDYWKQRNGYYYNQLKNALADLIPEPSTKSVLDIGCGTGDMLEFLAPKTGAGLDVSREMVGIARKKHPSYAFHVGPIETFRHKPVFDYILFIDVIEHVSDLNATFDSLARLMNERTRLVIMMANPLWEPALLLLEKLGKKMPEGPHYRPSAARVRKMLQSHGLLVERHTFRQLVPMQISGLSEGVNQRFYRVPLLRKLGLTEIFVVATGNHISS
jgi:ubiquinone/menaquinone biosynthesis C-methylase UbiE